MPSIDLSRQRLDILEAMSTGFREEAEQIRRELSRP
jgi:hypothetical protein